MKLSDWRIGGLEDLIYLPQRTQRRRGNLELVVWRSAGFSRVERAERVEDCECSFLLVIEFQAEMD